MGFRFQRRAGLLSGLVRLNLSKSGVSMSVGPRGVGVNVPVISTRNTKPSYHVGLPGTGLSYRQTIDVQSQPVASTPVAPSNELAANLIGYGGPFVLFAVLWATMGLVNAALVSWIVSCAAEIYSIRRGGVLSLIGTMIFYTPFALFGWLAFAFIVGMLTGAQP